MKLTDNQQKAAAKKFAEFWKDKGYEKGESQEFWIDLLVNVFGVENIAEFISFEDQVHLDHTSFIDIYIPSTRVMISVLYLLERFLQSMTVLDLGFEGCYFFV